MRLRKFVFKKISSTNDKAMELIKKGFKSGIIITDNQTKGRGRYGRNWISLKGNLFMSVFYLMEKKDLTQLTKFNCKIVASALKKYTKLKITIKPPNDLLYEKKKICGILQEKVNKFNHTYLIVGIGVNLIKSPFLKNYPTTHLRELVNKDISKKKFELKLKKIFENNLKRLIKKRV